MRISQTFWPVNRQLRDQSISKNHCLCFPPIQFELTICHPFRHFFPDRETAGDSVTSSCGRGIQPIAYHNKQEIVKSLLFVCTNAFRGPCSAIFFSADTNSFTSAFSQFVYRLTSQSIHAQSLTHSSIYALNHPQTHPLIHPLPHQHTNSPKKKH